MNSKGYISYNDVRCINLIIIKIKTIKYMNHC